MRIGLIGLGAIGAIRAAALSRHATCELGGVFDVDPGRCKQVAPTARAYENLDQMLEAPDLDAVVISTPPETHEQFAVQAMTRGKHVLIEKPLAPTVAAAAHIVRTSYSTGTVATVGYNHRYFPAAKLVRDAVKQGRIGKLSHVRGYTGHAGLEEFKAAWMYNKEMMGGGALMDNGTHMLDLVRYIMGDAEEVFALTSNAVWGISGVEDYALVSLRSKDGVIGTIEASWDEWKGYRFHLDAYGDKGMARLYYAPMSAMLVIQDRPGGKRTTTRYRYLRNVLTEKFRGWQSTVVRTFDEEFADFAALASGQPTSGRISTIEDGFRAVEIAHASYESSRTGAAVSLSPFASF